MSATIAPTREREIAYNAYLSSLDQTELNAYLRCNTVEGESLELVLHDSFVAGIIAEDTLGAEILNLLGEL